MYHHWRMLKVSMWCGDLEGKISNMTSPCKLENDPNSWGIFGERWSNYIQFLTLDLYKFPGNERVDYPTFKTGSERKITLLRAGMGYVSRCIDILVSRRVSIHVNFFPLRLLAKLIGNKIKGPTPLILSLEKRQKLQHDSWPQLHESLNWCSKAGD